MFRIGYGYDVHKFAKDRKLILGGVHIPYEYGLLGHSDADVLIHSVMDAILGALAKGDIGKLFPDTDKNFKNIDSTILLKKVIEIMKNEGYKISNLDATIIAEKPKLLPHIELMRKNIARLLDTDIKNISIKATTQEGLGLKGMGIASSTVVLLTK
jgi:2-C-methyl-D-erythritol 2,4-cyclodiphosphate synthase